MLISKVLDSPLTSRALPRSAGGRLRGRTNSRWALMPCSLVALMALALTAVTAVESVQAQTTGFRIYLDDLLPALDAGDSYMCERDPNTPTVQPRPALGSMTATMPENAAPATLTYTYGSSDPPDSRTSPNFSTCGAPADATVTWAFAANRTQSYQGFNVTYGPATGNDEGAGGTLTHVEPAADFESTRTYTLRIIARYSGGSDGTTGEASVTVNVNVTNVDESPVFTDADTPATDSDPAEYKFELAENLDGSTTPHTVGSFTVEDPDDSQALIQLTNTNNDFEIHNRRELRYTGSGVNISERNTPQLTTETVVVTATSGSAPATRANFMINIVDYPMFDQVNSESQLYDYEFGLNGGITKGSVIGAVQASSRIGRRVEYEILMRDCTGPNPDTDPSRCNYKDSLTVNTNTGEISFDHVKVGEPKEPVPPTTNASFRIPNISLIIRATEVATGCGVDDVPACETSLATVTVMHTGAGGLLTFPGSPITINLPENEATRTPLTTGCAGGNRREPAIYVYADWHAVKFIHNQLH